ncbi:MAG TPA: (d)CMP kinase [Ruminococcaceae bacterium]|nr:(d)CMP kinase [Oscillospiraceae bacterium]
MISIAVDGPSGAGKSTLAKALADRLGYIYADTGALYRTIGLYMLEKKIETKDSEAVAESLKGLDIRLEHRDGSQRIYLNGNEIGEEIRAPEVSMAASDVSAHPTVRDFLLELQRKIAEQSNVIMDGRDIGTVVLPNATLKIFLTADVKERAQRRLSQLEKQGIKADYSEVLSDMRRRDYNDTHRETAPLRKAHDAVLIDTTGMEKEQSMERLYSVVSERINVGGR